MYKRNRHAADITYAHQNRVAVAETTPAVTITPKIAMTTIGRIDMGVDGSDEYILLTRKDDDLDPDFAHDWLLAQAYRESHLPGGYYCTSVTVLPTGNKCVAIVHHRYDV